MRLRRRLACRSRWRRVRWRASRRRTGGPRSPRFTMRPSTYRLPACAIPITTPPRDSPASHLTGLALDADRSVRPGRHLAHVLARSHDALVSRLPLPPGKPLIVFLMIGETARADSFQLGGYARETNPELARRGVLYFSNVTACGTSTAVSLPCMFSGDGREAFDAALSPCQSARCPGARRHRR